MPPKSKTKKAAASRGTARPAATKAKRPVAKPTASKSKAKAPVQASARPKTAGSATGRATAARASSARATKTTARNQAARQPLTSKGTKAKAGRGAKVATKAKTHAPTSVSRTVKSKAKMPAAAKSTTRTKAAAKSTVPPARKSSKPVAAAKAKTGTAKPVLSNAMKIKASVPAKAGTAAKPAFKRTAKSVSKPASKPSDSAAASKTVPMSKETIKPLKATRPAKVEAAKPELQPVPTAKIPESRGSGDVRQREAVRPMRTADTKSVVAALMAARKKAAPANDARPQTSKGTNAVKGGGEVAQHKVKTKVEHGAAPVQSANESRPASPVSAPSGTGHAPAQSPAPAAAPMVRAAAKPAVPKDQVFKTGEFIVYPAHGVGEIVAVEQQEVAGYKLELFVISFIKDKMILKVPLPKIASVGMRKLAGHAVITRALDTLTGRARIKRTMWSRRAQEYEAKINSGDLVSIAEVVRDLYRSDAQPEQSYSERQLYEAALDRMGRELAAVQSLTDTEALKLIDDQLQKGPRRGKTEENDADDPDSDESEETTQGGIGEAA